MFQFQYVWSHCHHVGLSLCVAGLKIERRGGGCGEGSRRPRREAEEESGELSPLHLIVLFGTATMGMGSDNPNEEGHGFHFHAAGIHRRCLKKM